jgi:hypothetical protein
MSFQTIELANNNVLVKGTDALGVSGQTVIDGTYWAERKRRAQIEDAHEKFDAAVEEFYAPIVAAMEATNKAVQIDRDPLLYVVEQEASEGAHAREEVVVRLDDASVILRAIEQGRTDRLIWVGDKLVVTAAPVPTSTPAPTEVVDLDQVTGEDGEGISTNPSTV